MKLMTFPPNICLTRAGLLTLLLSVTMAGQAAAGGPDATLSVTGPSVTGTPLLAQRGSEAYLQSGDEGAAVEMLQWALHRHGVYERSLIDGYYGDATTEAVEKYQANRQLSVTGKADVETLSALGIADEIAAMPRLIYPGYGEIATIRLAFGDAGVDVTVLQTVLREVYRHGDTVVQNGTYDDVTRQAVRVFQRAQGLDVTGIADRPTLLALGFEEMGAATGVSRVGGPEGPAPTNGRYYAVVIAGRNRLADVRAFYDDAFVLSTSRGDVISVGVFDNVRSADTRVRQAQNRGFRADALEGWELE
ncbi:MAG: peptidoglycan-binding protein [Cyanobacteria bacterium P01_A01_bin.105]